jgi:transcriptional regulator with XRE-family HTH domain
MSGDLKSHIGARVKQARKAKKFTQAEVADRLGKAVETISNIERGASWTSLEMLENLSKLLGEQAEFFFEGYSGGKRKSRSRLQLESELATLLRDLTEDQLRVVRDLARSLSATKAK